MGCVSRIRKGIKQSGWSNKQTNGPGGHDGGSVDQYDGRLTLNRGTLVSTDDTADWNGPGRVLIPYKTGK